MSAQSLPGVSHLRSTISHKPRDEQKAWAIVRSTLLQSAESLRQWSYVLGGTQQPPNAKTVADLTVLLDDFHIVQDELIQWLGHRSQQAWITLRRQLTQSSFRQLWSKTRVSLSSYKKLLDDCKDIIEECSKANKPLPQRINRALSKERIQAGDDVLRFANALKEAVEQAGRGGFK